jgi:hypothetical protein
VDDSPIQTVTSPRQRPRVWGLSRLGKK